jgi:hypothetical protein
MDSNDVPKMDSNDGDDFSTATVFDVILAAAVAISASFKMSVVVSALLEWVQRLVNL